MNQTAVFLTGYSRLACSTQIVASIGKEFSEEIKGKLESLATGFFTTRSDI